MKTASNFPLASLKAPDLTPADLDRFFNPIVKLVSNVSVRVRALRVVCLWRHDAVAELESVLSERVSARGESDIVGASQIVDVDAE